MPSKDSAGNVNVCPILVLPVFRSPARESVVAKCAARHAKIYECSAQRRFDVRGSPARSWAMFVQWCEHPACVQSVDPELRTCAVARRPQPGRSG